MPTAVAILEVMWDWRGMTSGAGYDRIAPDWYSINPDNFTGSRLYNWLGHSDLLVTNACPQLVYSASQKGTPDVKWLTDNLNKLHKCEVVLVCGKVAQITFLKANIASQLAEHLGCRILLLPHPAARTWTRRALTDCRRLVQGGVGHSCSIIFNGSLVTDHNVCLTTAPPLIR